jgi:adenine-specific DNA-methyltransferase
MSDIFWFYIKNTSKPYSGNYFSLAKNYVKNFGICNLTNKEKEKLIKMTNQNKINEFLFQKYDIQKSDFVNYSPMLGKKNVKVKI